MRSKVAEHATRGAIVFKHALWAGLAVVTSGCAGVPSLEFRTERDQQSHLLIRQALCEVTKSKSFDHLHAGKFVLAVKLTTQAEDNVGAAPTLNFVDPSAAVPALNRTTVLGGEISKKRERSLTEDAVFKLGDWTHQAACDDTQEGDQGEFGFKSLLDRRSILPQTPMADGKPVSPTPPYVPTYAVVDPRTSSFASQAKFTVKWAAAAGPNSTRRRFKGPSDKGFLSASRIDTSTIYIAITKPAPPSPTPAAIEALAKELADLIRTPAEASFLAQKDAADPGDVARVEADIMARARVAARRQLESPTPLEEDAAVRRAQDAITQMILQNLTVSSR